MRILVVEDEKRIADFLCRGLEGAGYAVDAAPTGGAALECIHATDYDMVILDRMLPDMDGLQVLEKIRNRKVGPPVLILSARGALDDRVTGLEQGADDYLVKPFDPAELRARINVGVRVLSLQERLADRVTELQDALANVKVLHGLLPICSYCKRIRGDDQYWTQVESYIAERSDAQFSHGICPPCANVLEREIEEHRNSRSGGH